MNEKTLTFFKEQGVNRIKQILYRVPDLLEREKICFDELLQLYQSYTAVEALGGLANVKELLKHNQPYAASNPLYIAFLKSILNDVEPLSCK